MKKRVARIIASFLVAIMIIVGIGPMEYVKAESEPIFTVKTTSSSVKPGEKITAELWLEPGFNVTSFVVNFVFDTNTFEFVKKSGKKGEVVTDASMSSVDVDEELGSISILVDFEDEPNDEGGLVYSMELTVKKDASGTGFIGIELNDKMGVMVIGEGGSETKIPTEDVKAECQDENGNVFDGNVVVDIPLVSLEFDQKSFTMARGTEDTLNLTATPANALTGKTVKWSSSDSSVVSVDQNGHIKALKRGKATIKAEVGETSASVDITVDVPLGSIALNKSELTLRKGTTETLEVAYDPEDTTDSKTVTWNSSDSTVATVDANGKVTALKAGTAEITATVGTKKASCDLTVEEVPLTGIELNESSITLVRNATKTLNVTYTPADTTDDKTVTWSSSDKKIATVEDGVVTAKGCGEATITAKVGSNTATCKVTVNAPLTAISLNKTKTTILKNQTEDISVKFDPEDTTDSKEITWSVSNPDVAEIVSNDTTVTVKGKKQGTAVLTAEAANGLKATCDITVEEKGITGITVDPTEKTLEVGETVTCNVTYQPADTTDEKAVTWSSSNEKVATVDENGVVTAVAGGTAEITATTANGATATCKIKVPIHLTGISLDKTSMEIFTNDTAEPLNVTYNPENTDDEKAVTWKSSNNTVATVDDKGQVTGVEIGRAVITATSTVGGFEATCEVTVSELEEIKLELDGAADVEETAMERNGESTLEVKATQENALEHKKVTWTSSDEKVVTVEANTRSRSVQGTSVKIKAVGIGTATVTAEVEGKKASIKIKVSAPLNSIKLNKETLSLSKGQSETLEVIYDPDDTTDGKTVTWSSSDEEVATVDANGKVTALKDGTADVTAKVGEKTATCKLTVTEKPLTGIALDESEITLKKNETKTLNVAFTPADTTDDKTVEWSSSDEKVATVENGVVTAKDFGTATITAKVGSLTATCKVIVNEPLTAIKLDKEELSLIKNETETVTVSYEPENTTDKKAVEWSISDPEVAEIEADGDSVTVKAKKQGTAVLTAKTANGLTATCDVKVTEKNITEITVDPIEKTLEVGETVTCTVTYAPEDTTDEKTVTWSSSNEKVATVDKNGVVTAVGGGTADIVAKTESGATAKCTIKVPVHLTGISLETTSLKLKKDETSEPLVVVYEPENTDDEKAVTWKSSDETVATVDEDGKVTAVSEGTATITATSTVGGFEATCEVTVTEEEELESVSLNKKEFVMARGTEETLEVTATPESALEGKTIVWSTSDAKVVKVDQTGHVKAVGIGKATITAEVDGLKAAAIITVNAPIVALTLDKAKVELVKYETETVSVQLIPADTTDSRIIKWTISDPTVADIIPDGTSVDIKGKAQGEAILTAWACNGISASCIVEVKEKPLTQIMVDPAEKTMEVGEKVTCKVIYVPEDTTDEKDVTWSSTDEKVAIVDENGVVTAVGVGTADIVATTANGLTAKCVITVPAKEEPTVPGDPSTPEEPVDPEEPTDPDNPTTPEEPVEPENPTDPEDPSKPENPEEPTNPDNPTTPGDNGNKPGTDDSGNSIPGKGETGKNNSTSNKVNKPAKSETVKTGDNANVFSVVLTMLLSLSVIGVILIQNNRKRKVHR